jgi:hypothetical protein
MLYGYPNFICDTGGSICEWVDADDPNDPILTELSKHTLLIWLKGTQAHTAELIRRFDRAPKPMAYQPEFLTSAWAGYLAEKGCAETEVDPDAFIRWTYARALAHRQPRYEAMAKWGITIPADSLHAVTDEAGFEVVNREEGISIKVGPGQTCARFRLPDTRAVADWLGSLRTRFEDAIARGDEAT